MLTEFLIIFLLIFVNGLLAGSEMAVVSVRKTRLTALAEGSARRARALVNLRSNPERFLATVQIGITVVGTTAGAFGGSALAKHLEPLVSHIPGLAPYAYDVSFGLVVAMVSYLSLVLGELVPKSLALRAAEPFALLMARPLIALSWLARPLVWLLTASSNLVLKPFADSTTFTESRLSREELQELVDDAVKTGALDQHTSALASRALEFDQLTGSDVMVPRNRMVALPINADSDLIRRCLLEERRSRIPVYEGTVDNVVGYITDKDVLALAWEGRLIVLKDVVRPIRLFLESTPASQLLQFMQSERQRLVLLVDEHGAVAGLVTFEDLVEELVGEVFSEHDRQAPPIVIEPSGALLVRGDVPLRDLGRELGVELQEPDGIRTVAGLCSALAGGVVPQRGARLADKSGVVIEVLEATARAVRRVRVSPLPKVEPLVAEPREPSTSA